MILYSKIEGEGKPLFIFHGFLGMSDNWKSLGAQYAQEGFQVHLIDLRNHGRSFHSDAFDYTIMVQDVLDYFRAQGIERANIIGHSMGGKVAMLLATLHPEKVDKVIIADIGPKFYPQHHQTILEGLNAVDFSTQPSRNKVEEILSQYIPDFGTRQFLMKNLYWKTSNQLDFRFNLKVLTEKIDQVGVALPKDLVFNGAVLFIRGGNSNYIVQEDLETISHHFPKSELKAIEGAGHWLHAENPKLFFDLSYAFLKQ
jgi:pimeloyl-ACP methyl ester carboxylesterase